MDQANGVQALLMLGTGGSNLPASITLLTASQSTYVSQTFTNVLPGTYQVGETVPSGWDLTATDCGGTPAASNPAAFTLARLGYVQTQSAPTRPGQFRRSVAWPVSPGSPGRLSAASC